MESPMYSISLKRICFLIYIMFMAIPALCLDDELVRTGGPTYGIQKKSKQEIEKSEKTFDCPLPLCGKFYTRKHNLKAHFLRKHPEEISRYQAMSVSKRSTKKGKKWKCPISSCMCGYTRKGDLKTHFLKKHPDLVGKFHKITKNKSTKMGKSHPCPLDDCVHGYTHFNDLKYHIKNKHSESHWQNFLQENNKSVQEKSSSPDDELSDEVSLPLERDYDSYHKSTDMVEDADYEEERAAETLQSLKTVKFYYPCNW